MCLSSNVTFYHHFNSQCVHVDSRSYNVRFCERPLHKSIIMTQYITPVLVVSIYCVNLNDLLEHRNNNLKNVVFWGAGLVWHGPIINQKHWAVFLYIFYMGHLFIIIS